MRTLALLALLAAGCGGAARPAEVWYDQAEVVCYRASCGACRGGGHVGCDPCGGDGQVRCGSCRGRGRVRCGTCDGDGQHKDKACKTCGGSGRVSCATCSGDGLEGCGPCGGRGRVHCLRPIRIHEPLPEGEDVWPPVPPKR